MSVEANSNKKRRSASEDDVVVLAEEDREQESLRSKTADLKVIIGGACNSAGEEAVLARKGKKQKSKQYQQKVFWHFSQVLASQSRYVDTLLSNPLNAVATVAAATGSPATATTRSKKKQRRSSNSHEDNDDTDDAADYKVIAFPDITPTLWEKMMEYITSPASILSMSTTVAMQLIVPYDKYEFTTGIELCDTIMSNYIEKKVDTCTRKSRFYSSLDDGVRIIKMIVTAHEKNLYQTINTGMYWFTELLKCEWNSRIFFTVSHVQELVPVIDRFINGEKDNHRYGKTCYRTRLKKQIKAKMTYTNEGYDFTSYDGNIGQDSIDILNPMFPRLLISHLRLIAAQKFTMHLVDEITITGCPVIDGTFVPGSDYAGIPTFYRDFRRMSSLLLMRNNIGDWSIVEWDDDEDAMSRVIFVCKGSRYHTLPPPHHWDKVRDLGNADISGHPKLKYFIKSGEEVEIDFEE